jgi:hypothetical protein
VVASRSGRAASRWVNRRPGRGPGVPGAGRPCGAGRGVAGQVERSTEQTAAAVDHDRVRGGYLLQEGGPGCGLLGVALLPGDHPGRAESVQRGGCRPTAPRSARRRSAPRQGRHPSTGRGGGAGSGPCRRPATVDAEPVSQATNAAGSARRSTSGQLRVVEAPHPVHRHQVVRRWPCRCASTVPRTAHSPRDVQHPLPADRAGGLDVNEFALRAQAASGAASTVRQVAHRRTSDTTSVNVWKP